MGESQNEARTGRMLSKSIVNLMWKCAQYCSAPMLIIPDLLIETRSDQTVRNTATTSPAVWSAFRMQRTRRQLSGIKTRPLSLRWNATAAPRRRSNAMRRRKRQPAAAQSQGGRVMAGRAGKDRAPSACVPLYIGQQLAPEDEEKT